jgi:hypothetical protein
MAFMKISLYYILSFHFLGIIPNDFDAFYKLAQDGCMIRILVAERRLGVMSVTDPKSVWSDDRAIFFDFKLSQMEEHLIAGGGLTDMYHRYGKALFRAAMAPASVSTESKSVMKNVSQDVMKKLGNVLPSFSALKAKMTRTSSASCNDGCTSTEKW